MAQLSHKIRKTSVHSNFSAKEKLNFEKVILADSVLPRQNVRAVRPHHHFTPCLKNEWSNRRMDRAAMSCFASKKSGEHTHVCDPLGERSKARDWPRDAAVRCFFWDVCVFFAFPASFSVGVPPVTPAHRKWKKLSLLNFARNGAILYIWMHIKQHLIS